MFSLELFLFRQYFFHFLSLFDFYTLKVVKHKTITQREKRVGGRRKEHQFKKYTETGADDNVVWEDLHSFNEQDLVQSGWEAQKLKWRGCLPVLVVILKLVVLKNKVKL